MVSTLIDKSKGDLIWIVGDKVMEVILRNCHFVILNAKKKELYESGGYKIGRLQTVGWRTGDQYKY